MNKLFVVTMTTRHFTFEAAGSTRAEAEDALVAGWRRHLEGILRSHGRNRSVVDMAPVRESLKMTFAELEEEYEVRTAVFEPGVCLRDGDEI